MNRCTMNIIKRTLLAIFLLASALSSRAQVAVLKGYLLNAGDQSPLPGANLILTDASDSSRKLFTTSGAGGIFSFQGILHHTYYLKARYLGFKSLDRKITLDKPSLVLGPLTMIQSGRSLKEVKVIGNIPPTQANGDTIAYNARAYKTNPDATAEDLVGKMPGITVASNGSVTAHGETVQKVLVDGKPFFGNDPTTALRNLPAEVVSKVQVFDKMSDQAQFTGFDDGNSVKTMNIVTRRNKRNGQFGKFSAGYGTDGRYTIGGAINSFNKDRRISLIGLSNNVNQQNFAIQDVLGVMGTGNGGFGGGGGNFRGGPGGVGNFLVWNQPGIATTNSIGLNYSDSWGKKITVSGSYFFNNIRNNIDETLTRNYFLSSDSNQVYNEQDLSNSNNYNHRFNLRLVYTIDPHNSLIITPNLSFQNYHSLSGVSGAYMAPDSTLLSQTMNHTHTGSNGYNMGNDILYRHSFAKMGRTISVDFHTEWDKKDGNTDLYSQNNYYKTLGTQNDSLSQRSLLHSNSNLYSTNIVYTEPIGKSSQLALTYNNSLTSGVSNKNTFNYDYVASQYSQFDTALSNDYQDNYQTNLLGLNYRYRGKKGLFLMGGLSYQNALLTGKEIFPGSANVRRNYNNILTNAMLRYQFSRSRNLRIFYRSRTEPPSIAELQNAIDNSNPLQLSTGNPNLQPQTIHFMFARYSAVNMAKSRMFFAFFHIEQASNYIANSTFTAPHDTLLPGNILLNKGSQLTQPVNLSGNFSANTFLTLGLPLSFMKSNLNLSGGISYNRSPGLVNGIKNFSNNYGLNLPLVISSNISQDLDFTVSYSPSYNIIRNSIQPRLNSNYFTNSASLRFNWIFWKGFEMNSDITYNQYSGLGAGYDKAYILWNGSIGKRFLKKQNAQIQLSVFDLLNQNTSISRTPTETYIEDSRVNVLQQYFMLTFTYTLRNFKPAPNDHDHPFMIMKGGPRPMFFGHPPGGRPGG